jgi:hypothetical protein
MVSMVVTLSEVFLAGLLAALDPQERVQEGM